MINRLILTVLFSVFGLSFAVGAEPTTPPSFRYIGEPVNDSPTGWASSPGSACDALFAKSTAGYTVHSLMGSEPNYQCYAGSPANPTYAMLGGVRGRWRCPAMWITEPVPYDAGGVCGPACPSGTMGSVNIEMSPGANGALARPKAVDGCGVDVMNVNKCYQVVSTGQKVCSLDLYRTGEYVPASDQNSKVDGSSTSKAPIPVVKTTVNNSGGCPGGTVNGGIDSGGIPICIGSGSNPPTSATSQSVVTVPTSTVTDANGVTTQIKQTSSVNVDGSSTVVKQTTTTTAAGVSTSSTNVNTTLIPSNLPNGGKEGVPSGGGPDGSLGARGKSGAAGLDGTNGKDGVDFCVANPHLSVCRNSSVSGSCLAVACDGDAIQCATLRAAAAIQCKLNDDDGLKTSAEYLLGSAAAAGNDPLKSSFPTIAGATVIQAPSQLDASGWLGGGSCFVDKTVSIMGQQILLPFSKTCDSLLILRYALMVVAGLVSFKIISGAILT